MIHRWSVMAFVLLGSCLLGKSRIDQQHSSSSQYDPLVQATWTLVDLQIPPNGLAASPADGGTYQAQATFCKIDWTLHQQNPSMVSFFADLRNLSSSCLQEVTVDLADMVRQSRAYDQRHPHKIRVVPPTAVIFHQSRCGSTLAANMLAAFDPTRTRVYSEHYPPITALRACAEYDNNSNDSNDNDACHPDTHLQLIRDVYYILGRAPHTEPIEYVFYKSNSGAMFIDKFTAAFPDTPWAVSTVRTNERRHCRSDSTCSVLCLFSERIFSLSRTLTHTLCF